MASCFACIHGLISFWCCVCLSFVCCVVDVISLILVVGVIQDRAGVGLFWTINVRMPLRLPTLCHVTLRHAS